MKNVSRRQGFEDAFYLFRLVPYLSYLPYHAYRQFVNVKAYAIYGNYYDIEMITYECIKMILNRFILQ